MNQEKYIGMDVHAATISAAVRNAEGKLLMEGVLETKAATILEFIQGLRGTLALTFEEGTLAAWLHDLLKPHVSRLVVCAPRKNGLLRDGNQNDRVDARNLAELLRTNQVKPVYHEEHGIRTLKELGRSYSTLTQDSTRVRNGIKSVYRSWAIPCAGTSVDISFCLNSFAGESNVYQGTPLCVLPADSECSRRRRVCGYHGQILRSPYLLIAWCLAFRPYPRRLPR